MVMALHASSSLAVHNFLSPLRCPTQKRLRPNEDIQCVMTSIEPDATRILQGQSASETIAEEVRGCVIFGYLHSVTRPQKKGRRKADITGQIKRMMTFLAHHRHHRQVQDLRLVRHGFQGDPFRSPHPLLNSLGHMRCSNGPRHERHRLYGLSIQQSSRRTLHSRRQGSLDGGCDQVCPWRACKDGSMRACTWLHHECQ
jgi:hypothetical protein